MNPRGFELKIWILIAAFAAFAFDASATVRKGPEMNLKQLTKNSDSVVIGKCRNKNVDWVGRSLETTYEVEVDETLKGKKFRRGEKFTVTFPGGELTTPPLSQYVALAPVMYVGEDVALFLKDEPAKSKPELAKRRNPKTKLFSGPQVVGWYEGKFSIFTDKRDGQRKISRLNLEQHGIIPSSRGVERLVRAISAGDVAVTTGPVIDLGDGLLTTPEGKELLDRALEYQDAQSNAAKASAAKRPRPSPSTPAQRARKPLTAQGLDDFKAEVRKFVEEEKK